VGITVEWTGRGLEEKGVSRDTGETVVRVTREYFRPCEVDTLCGDYSKIREATGWAPHVDFATLVKRMVKYDMQDVATT
jgi:GDPmannose 4,6-dehydratase